MLAFATALLPLLLQIPQLVKAGAEITSIIKSDPQTPEAIKAKIAEYNARLDEALEAVKNARLPG